MAKLRVDKTDSYTQVESEDGSVSGRVTWENNGWCLTYTDNRSRETGKTYPDEPDHWKCVGMLVTHLIKISYGVVIPDPDQS